MTTRHPLRVVDLNPHVLAKMHIHHSALGGIKRGAANGRISLAVADHYREVDAGNVAIQIPDCRVRWFPGAARICAQSWSGHWRPSSLSQLHL